MNDTKNAAAASATPPASLPPPSPEDRTVTTKHRAKIHGKSLAYTAICGTWVMHEAIAKDGEHGGEKPRAEMFFTAYSLDGVKNGAARPITFCFNGGPGSSSVWVHL